MIKGPIWSSKLYTAYHNTSYDGIHYQIESYDIMSGTYFFLSNERYEHLRKVYNVVNLISELGGLFSVLVTVIGMLGRYLNK